MYKRKNKTIIIIIINSQKKRSRQTCGVKYGIVAFYKRIDLLSGAFI